MSLPLYPHQRNAVEWMIQRESCCDQYGICGGMVCDEMGLGKTITTLELIRRQGGKTLIACPVNLMEQWKQECLRYLQKEPICIRRNDVYESLRLEHDDIVITSHTCFTMRDVCPYSVNIYVESFDRFVVDEAHCMKNTRSVMFQQCTAFVASKRWCLTGTPIMNCVLNPRSLHLAERKTMDIVAYVVFLLNGAEDAKSVGKMIASSQPSITPDIMIRRLKRDLLQIPDPVITTYTAPLDGGQDEYRRINRKAEIACARQEDDDTQHEYVIALIIKLRRLCSMAPWKFRALRDHVQGYPVGSKILVFCNYLDEMQMARDTLEDCVDVVMEYHGTMTETERQNVITEFMTPSPQSKVIVMQIQCGSAGLNLQSAQYVFIMSPTWNPGIERQAMARAHRSNTPHIVNVTRYVTQNTIESFMYLRQKNKDTVSNTLLQESTPNIDGTLYQLREGTSVGIECCRDALGWGSNKLFQSLDMDDIPDDDT